jgi:deoxyribonuclease V
MTGAVPIAILDAAYASNASGVACVLADAWTAAAARAELSRRFAGAPAAYVPGEFYKRELPLLLAVIGGLSTRPATLVIDGYVWLGADGTPGLGGHLFQALQPAIPVIGVAKTQFGGDTWSTPVCRGNSRRPLYVTAAGVGAATAAALVSGMHGKNRIPTLLQRADRLAGGAEGRPAGNENRNTYQWLIKSVQC